MKKFYQILTWGLLAVLTSCSDEAKQVTEPEGVKAYTQFYANIVDEMAETRSTLLNDKKIAFEVGDAIQLYVDNGLKTDLCCLTARCIASCEGQFRPLELSKLNWVYGEGTKYQMLLGVWLRRHPQVLHGLSRELRATEASIHRG